MEQPYRVIKSKDATMKCSLYCDKHFHRIELDGVVGIVNHEYIINWCKKYKILLPYHFTRKNPNKNTIQMPCRSIEYLHIVDGEEVGCLEVLERGHPFKPEERDSPFQTRTGGDLSNPIQEGPTASTEYRIYKDCLEKLYKANVYDLINWFESKNMQLPQEFALDYEKNKWQTFTAPCGSTLKILDLPKRGNYKTFKAILDDKPEADYSVHDLLDWFREHKVKTPEDLTGQHLASALAELATPDIYTIGSDTIEIYKFCRMSLPCQHGCVINGSAYDWDGVQIARWFKKRGQDPPGHFLKYTNERYASFVDETDETSDELLE